MGKLGAEASKSMSVDFDSNAGSRPLKPRHFRKLFLSSAAPMKIPEANREAAFSLAPRETSSFEVIENFKQMQSSPCA
jgi:hypothetical protein